MGEPWLVWEDARMSYVEAKEIALLRLELRACVDRADRTAARAALSKLAQHAAAGNDNELVVEIRRWEARLSP